MIEIKYGGPKENQYRHLASREQTKLLLLHGKENIAKSLNDNNIKVVRHIVMDAMSRNTTPMTLNPRGLALPSQNEVVTVVIPERKNNMNNIFSEKTLSVVIGAALIGASIAGLYGAAVMTIIGAALSYLMEKGNKKK